MVAYNRNCRTVGVLPAMWPRQMGILPHYHACKRNCGVPHTGGLRGEHRYVSTSTRRVPHRHAILNEAVMQETYLAITEEAVGVWGQGDILSTDCLQSWHRNDGCSKKYEIEERGNLGNRGNRGMSIDNLTLPI